MTPERLRELLQSVATSELSVDDALDRLRTFSFEDLGFAKIDHHRALRTGVPEVILAEGKTSSQVAQIASRMRAAGDRILITRLDPQAAAVVVAAVPELTYCEVARVALLQDDLPVAPGRGVVAVVAAGTSDLPVAEEAAVTVEHMGSTVERVYDVGVAGIHRLFAHLEILRRARVLIVVAGMEGALASVVGGLVDRPVIAVPTSIGYGASFGGLAALLAMLNSCAAGITVVNIDNGFGAGIAAGLINRE
jgi:hypothetical protein